MQNKIIAITTIHEKSQAIKEFEKIPGWSIIIAGDNNSEPIDNSSKCRFISFDEQGQSDFELNRMMPAGHYCRKNAAYLEAISNCAEIIYDSDDDNFPKPNWKTPDFNCSKILRGSKFINIYQMFTHEHAWPRGFPLDEINTAVNVQSEFENSKIAVWQSLADGDPDLDAIYRLTSGKSVEFENTQPFALDRGCYSPINSQATFWNNNVFELLYLPATVSMRFSDILRGLVAQRLMWEKDLRAGFMHAVVYQERNDHDLMKDFKDEIDCYLNVKKIVDLLDKTDFDNDLKDNLLQAYEILGENGFTGNEEPHYVRAWIDDLNRIGR